MTATTKPVHWHAFAYTGKGYTDSEVFKGLAPANFPPQELKNWLQRLPGLRTPLGSPVPESAHPVHTFTEEQIDKAVTWLEKELNTHIPTDAETFPVTARIEYSRARLMESANRDVVYGYWSVAGMYVSRVLILCDDRGPANCR